MKKGVSFIWDSACQQAFEEIKEYLIHPPILVAPVSGKPFMLYVRAMDHSLGSLLAQCNDQNHEQVIYYLSRTMIEAEHRYNPLKKKCLALVFAIQKMRHYLIGQRIHVISRVNSLWLLITRPSSLNCRLAKWAILLSQYEMHFMPQKKIKGQTVPDFLANHPISKSSKFYDDLLDEITEVNASHVSLEEQVWRMFFDGASRTSPEGNIIAGVEVVLISPHNHVIPYAFSLTEPCSNNV